MHLADLQPNAEVARERATGGREHKRTEMYNPARGDRPTLRACVSAVHMKTTPVSYTHLTLPTILLE